MYKNNWIRCDSKEDMQSRIRSSGYNAVGELITADANAWGYLEVKNEGFCIPVGFVDVGLLPEILLCDSMFYVGISDTVAGYELGTSRLVFKYMVPTVFHEFIVSKLGGIIVQDETGFIGLSCDGNQKWMNMCSDTIDTYQVSGDLITGRTTDGDSFEFTIT